MPQTDLTGTQSVSRRDAIGTLARGGLAMSALALAPTTPAIAATSAPAPVSDFGEGLTSRAAARDRVALLRAWLKEALTAEQYGVVEQLVDAESTVDSFDAAASREELIEVTARHAGDLAPWFRATATHVRETDNGGSAWCGLGIAAETVEEFRAAYAGAGLPVPPIPDVSPCVARARRSAA
jgi:hypothetical protein